MNGHRRGLPTSPLKTLSRFLFPIAFLFLVLLLGGCGQVVTKPTATVFIPTATPTPTRETPTPTPTATTTPIPATPEPTATPTPEPTPIIHTLQAGDTLIGLARKYGVTVQAIQEANGITDPRGLLVGQQIIIPTDPEARLSAGTPTPAPTPPPARISPLTFSEQAGVLWALGELTLTGGDPIEDVVVQVDLLDQSGQVIASAQTPMLQTMLAPGEPAGFAVRFAPPPGRFASYYSQIVNAMPAHTALAYRDLTIENLLAQQSGDAVFSLSGQIVNTGAAPARNITVSVILYDEAGQVTGVRQVPADPSQLQPGETAFFSAELIPVHLPVADYHLLAEGQRVQLPND